MTVTTSAERRESSSIAGSAHSPAPNTTIRLPPGAGAAAAEAARAAAPPPADPGMVRSYTPPQCSGSSTTDASASGIRAASACSCERTASSGARPASSVSCISADDFWRRLEAGSRPVDSFGRTVTSSRSKRPPAA